ncbi:hypothetical protein F2P81_006583 [Scophthalmus maximus]|uniref:Uncharacterized protein n=1 Tax=Scophthalmus maximus TaxID=52904 RepID=A0A6A4T6A5_SCOMX|nr:hypothetical protein F2P81_006583 [Scophthalmus maximus]
MAVMEWIGPVRQMCVSVTDVFWVSRQCWVTDTWRMNTSPSKECQSTYRCCDFFGSASKRQTAESKPMLGGEKGGGGWSCSRREEQEFIEEKLQRERGEKKRMQLSAVAVADGSEDKKRGGGKREDHAGGERPRSAEKLPLEFFNLLMRRYCTVSPLSSGCSGT